MSEAFVSRAQQWLVVLAVLGASALAGAVVPIYAGIMGESVARLMALPALLVLGLALIFSPRALLLTILILRAGTDHLFEATRVPIMGYVTGVGGLVNAFVLLIVIVLVCQRPGLFPRKYAIYWVPFLTTAAVSVAIAPSKSEAVRLYLTFLTYFAVFIAAFYVVESKRDWRKAVHVVIWSSLVPAGYALVDIALSLGRVGLGSFRLESTFTHANILAFYLTLILTLILYVVKSDLLAHSRTKRFWLIVYAFYLVALLILTQTRAAWISCATVFCVYGLFFQRRYLLYIAFAAGLALMLPPVQERLLDLTQGTEYTQYARLNSLAWRQLLWESALQWMQPSRYALGYGAQSFGDYAQIFFPLAGEATPGAHNVYVQWIFEFGVVGLLALLWLFYKLLLALWRIRTADVLAAFAMVMSLVAYLISSISDNMMAYLAFNWYLWFITGAALAAFGAAKRRRTESRSVDRAASVAGGVFTQRAAETQRN